MKPWSITALVALILLGALVAGQEIGPERLARPLAGMEASLEATLDPGRDRNLDAIAGIAARIESESGFPAQVMIAQWALESDWGLRPACRQNYFGMKRAPRHTAGCVAQTSEIYTENQIAVWNHAHPDRPAVKQRPAGGGAFEVSMAQEFADYASLEESARDYAEHIETAAPYAGAWATYQRSKDSKRLLNDLAGIYWTDRQYVPKALAVMDRAEVREALAAARSPEAPATPAAPRGLPPLQTAGLSAALASVALTLIGWAVRADSRARHEEFRRRVEGIQSALETKLADAEVGLHGRVKEELATALPANNLALMDRFNGRYLQTVRFDAAHKEMMAEIRGLRGGPFPPDAPDPPAPEVPVPPGKLFTLGG